MIIRNAIRCNICGDEIESTYRHDYAECKCGVCAVDGGHDYLRKPFDMSELLVRVESLLSRLEAPDASSELRVGKALFNADVGELRDGDRVEHLSSREAAILKILIQNRGKVVTYQQLLLDLWGDDSYYNLRSMNVFISNLVGQTQCVLSSGNHLQCLKTVVMNHLLTTIFIII